MAAPAWSEFNPHRIPHGKNMLPAGVFFNVLLPRWLQTILLTILLLVVVFKTFTKGIRMWQSERKDVALKQRLLADRHYHEEDSESETEGYLHDEAYHAKPHRLVTFIPLHPPRQAPTPQPAYQQPPFIAFQVLCLYLD